MSKSSPEVNIPIEEIMKVYGVWANDIAKALADRAIKEIRNNSKQFNKKTGYLRESIKRKKSKYSTDTYIVGALAPHAHLLEYGHAIVKNGVVVGHTPARPFVEPAESVVEQEVENIAKSVIGDIEVKG